MGKDSTRSSDLGGIGEMFAYLHDRIQAINNSKVFAGLMIISLNVVSRFVNIKVSKTMEAYLKFTFSKYILVFTIAWMGTRDIYIALVVLMCFIILVEFLFDEESMFYILPEEFKDYHISLLEEEESGNAITAEDIKKAEKVLENAKKQNRTTEFQGHSLK